MHTESSLVGETAGEVLRARWKKQQDHKTNILELLADLKSCSIKRNLECGKTIHAKSIASGNDSNLYVANALINMYAKCGSMADARRVFNSIKDPSVMFWTALILGYAATREGLTALDLFSRMKLQGCKPNSVTYLAVLKACASAALKRDRTECLEQVKAIHSEIGCHLDLFVIRQMRQHGSCSSENGEGQIALDLFFRMKSQGCTPDSRTYLAALKACTSLAQKEEGRGMCLERGKQIHLEIGCHLDPYLQATLIDMYAKCGSTVDARRVFQNMKRPDVVSWNALLSGYAESGEGFVTLDLFSLMKSQGCAPDSVSYVAVLKACTSLAAMKQDSSGKAECLERAKRIHSEIRCHSGLYVQNTLIDLYSKCGSMVDAREVFDAIKQPDVISWTSLLSGYAENGEAYIALDLFSRMKSQGCSPNTVTYVAILKACGLLAALEFGRKVHAKISEFDAMLVTSLVDFYAKCGSLEEAQEVFSEIRDLKTWTALLAGYSSVGETNSVFCLFEGMKDAGFQPDGVTFQCMLMCCSHAGLVVKAKEYFGVMLANYEVIPTVEHYTCMVDALGRAKKLDDAIVLLQRMPCSPDTVTWMTILGACRRWKNVEIGRLAFQSLVSLNEPNAAGYVLMADIYASRCMWEEQDEVLGMRRTSKVREELEQTCWTDEAGHVHKLLVRDCGHPQIQAIREKVKHMTEVVKAAHSSLSTKPDIIIDAQEAEALCGHSETLAIACALINTKPGDVIRIVKNFRVCDDCHKATSLISKLEGRHIFCRDVSALHVFKDGKCSCNDCW